MEYITTTALRTQSSQLIKTLTSGKSVTLIHRSKVVAIIQAKKKEKILKKSDIEQLTKFAKELKLPKISYAERERRYRKHLMGKYGKDLS